METQFIQEIMDGQEKNCPCCGRFAKVYKRRVHKTVALALLRLHKLGGASDYIHVKDFMGDVTGTGDIAKAAYWDLIVPMQNNDETKRTSGFWLLTGKGVSFVKGELGIREYAIVYDGRVIDFKGKTVYINDCIGAEFNYAELMERLQ